MTKITSRHAFSLLETCIAVFILGCAMLPILSGFGHASRGIAQTAEYSQALFLSHLALEKEQARFELDPLVALEDEAALRVPARPVVDGGSRYFEALEDTAEPFGRILPALDATLGPEREGLYRQLRSFTLGTEVTLQPHPDLGGTDRSIAEVQVGVAWKGLDGILREFTFPTLLARPQPNVSDQELDPQDYADAIRRQLFPGEPEGKSLEAIARERGADYRTIADLGLAVSMEIALEADFAQRDRELASADAWRDSAPPGDLARRAEAAIWRGKNLERKASLALHTPLVLIASLERLATGDFVARLGASPPAAERYVPQLWRLGFLPRAMVENGRESLVAYATAAQGELAAALPPRRLLALQYRLLRTSHVLRLAGLDLNEFLVPLLDGIVAQQDGKNPFVAGYASKYKTLLASPERLDTLFARWKETLDRLRGVPATVDQLARTGLAHQRAIGPPVSSSDTSPTAVTPSPAVGESSPGSRF